MKKTVKLLSFAFVIALSTSSFAQTFGVKAGLNLSNIMVKVNGKKTSDDNKLKPGFNIGGTANFEINDKFSFETGLGLSTKGSTHKVGDIRSSSNLLYIDIPLTAKMSFDMGGAKLYGILGPYCAIAVAASSKYDKTSTKIDIGSDKTKDGLTRFDYGLLVGAGVEIEAIQVGLTYGYGLGNVIPGGDADFKMNNRLLALSVGYRFGK